MVTFSWLCNVICLSLTPPSLPSLPPLPPLPPPGVSQIWVHQGTPLFLLSGEKQDLDSTCVLKYEQCSGNSRMQSCIYVCVWQIDFTLGLIQSRVFLGNPFMSFLPKPSPERNVANPRSTPWVWNCQVIHKIHIYNFFKTKQKKLYCLPSYKTHHLN